MINRIIPSSGERLPVIGLGTWKVFDVTASEYPAIESVLKKFHSGGGKLIDSSPMYGKSENVIGEVTGKMNEANDFFYATKVWTTGLQDGIQQMENSMTKMKRKTMDLMQIHNLVDWKTHLTTLRHWKEQGKIRYIGITHYRDDSHEDLEQIMKAEKPDFVQFNYSITQRNAEKRLFNAATSLGIATLINRPAGEGKLFGKVSGKPLPSWAGEYDIKSWSQYFLKYIICNDAVTCVIPATANPQHAHENVMAASGNMPDAKTKKKMIDYLEAL